MATKCSARAARKCLKPESVNILGVSLSVLIYMQMANGGNTSEILYSVSIWLGDFVPVPAVSVPIIGETCMFGLCCPATKSITVSLSH